MKKIGNKNKTYHSKIEDSVVSEAIAFRLGDISGLPEIAKAKIKSVYQTFFSAYLEIFRLKRSDKGVESPDLENLDADVLAYMRHFFSDYQHIYRQFDALNWRMQAIQRIDQKKFPQEFQAHIKDLISDTRHFDDESVLNEIKEIP
jgi:hypothetical protein